MNEGLKIPKGWLLVERGELIMKGDKMLNNKGSGWTFCPLWKYHDRVVCLTVIRRTPGLGGKGTK